jgi:hypothetical protein
MQTAFLRVHGARAGGEAWSKRKKSSKRHYAKLTIMESSESECTPTADWPQQARITVFA